MTITHAQPADLPSSSFFAQPLPRNEFPEQGMRPRDAFDLIHPGLRVGGQTVMRAVVRNDMSRDKVDIFMHQLEEACQYLDDHDVPATEPERKTHDNQRRRC